jgi:hypothetical protein
MTYVYTLRTPDGDDFGEVELAEPASPGDEIRGSGSHRMRVQAVFATGLVGEFVDGLICGILVIDPSD